jgi:hypothetical protein
MHEEVSHIVSKSVNCDIMKLVRRLVNHSIHVVSQPASQSVIQSL